MFTPIQPHIAKTGYETATDTEFDALSFGPLPKILAANKSLGLAQNNDMVLLHTPFPQKRRYTLASNSGTPTFTGNTSIDKMLARADGLVVASEYSQAMATLHKVLESKHASNANRTYVQSQIALVYMSNSALRDLRMATQTVEELSRSLTLRTNVPTSEQAELYAVTNRLRLELEKVQLLRKLRQRKEAFLTLKAERELLHSALEKLRQLTLEE